MYSDIKLISKSSREVNQLSFIQRLVCKLFKIKAEKKFELTITFESKDDSLRACDIVMIPTPSGNIRMMVTSGDESGILTAKSINLISFIPESPMNRLLRMGSAYREI